MTVDSRDLLRVLEGSTDADIDPAARQIVRAMDRIQSDKDNTVIMKSRRNTGICVALGEDDDVDSEIEDDPERENDDDVEGEGEGEDAERESRDAEGGSDVNGSDNADGKVSTMSDELFY